MAIARNFTWDVGVCLVPERSDLGRRFLRFSVIALMVISVLAPVVRLSDIFWLKLDQLLLPVVVLVYGVLLLAGLARPIRFNPLFAVGLLFSLCIAASLLYGTQVIGHPLLARDLFELVKALIPVLFFTLAFEANFPEQSLRRLAAVLVPTMLIICLYAYGQWFNLGFTSYLQPYYSGGLHDEGGLARYRRVYSTLSNPNFLGMLMTWVVAAFALAWLFRVGSRLWNIFLLFACVLALAMTGSRYGVVDTLLAVLLIFALPGSTRQSTNKRRRTLLVVVPILFGVLLAVAISNRATFERLQQLQNPLQENSLRMRLDDLWKDAVEKFTESPLLGHGPAKVIFSNIYTDSEYLQVLKQYGLIGFLSYLGYFLVPLRLVWRGLTRIRRVGPSLEQRWPATYWSVCFSFVALATALVMNIGMSTYYNPSLLAFLWMWMGIGASSANQIRRLSAYQGEVSKQCFQKN